METSTVMEHALSDLLFRKVKVFLHQLPNRHVREAIHTHTPDNFSRKEENTKEMLLGTGNIDQLRTTKPPPPLIT